jgi:hypothetical protein
MKLSFAHLSNAFMKASVLAHFYVARPICLAIDAYSFAIADIILHQKDNVYKGADSAMCTQILSGISH